MLQELLALGERIGNVNTGLSDHMVMKHLRRRKYSSATAKESAVDEPCCICRVETIPYGSFASSEIVPENSFFFFSLVSDFL